MMTVLILLALYLVPTLVGRNKENAVGIFLLNFFLGWTFVGYVVALIWALAARPKAAGVYRAAVAGELMCLEQLRDRGVLSWAEFERQKTRLLLYGYA